jgi:DNA-binding response OmpR family regulator
VTPRILIAECDSDIRELLEMTVRRLGYEAVDALDGSEIHAVLLEPGCESGRRVLQRFGDDAPPVVCLSIYPREHGLEPSSSVAYLTKPATTSEIADALSGIFAIQGSL